MISLTRTLKLLVQHLGHQPILEPVGGGTADVGGEVRGSGQHASQPGQVTVADELVPGHSEGAQAGRRLEGAAP